jgi:hypothetical protein
MTPFRELFPRRLLLLLHQSKAVKGALPSSAIVLFALSLAVGGASAETRQKAKAASSPASNAAVGECFKQSGGTYDPVKKAWTLHMSEHDVTVRSDTLRGCISRATGVAPGSVTLRERWQMY